MAKTLWFLNKCVDWGLDDSNYPSRSARGWKIGRRVSGGGDRIVNGETVCIDVNVPDPAYHEDSALGELMHEGRLAEHGGHVPLYDEYFVPIGAKCIGAPTSDFWKAYGTGNFANAADPNGKPYMQPAQLADYWTPPGASPLPTFGDVKMNTTAGVGLYEVLHRAKTLTGNDNVLIGYSQGGTVARYLAYMDENYVAPEDRCIAAVISVQSPNRGSPLATAASAPEVVSSLLLVLFALLKVFPDASAAKSTPLGTYVRQTLVQGGNIDIKVINALLDAALLTVLPANRSARNTLRTARKWLSGLDGLHSSAFFDLDTTLLDTAWSVLWEMNQHPLQATRHGSVVGTNMRLGDLVADAFLGDGVGSVFSGVLSSAVEGALADGETIYRTAAMVPSNTGPAAAVLRNDYLQGIPGAFGPRLHDFVIPSASQYVRPSGIPTKLFLGNLINNRANHLFGADNSSVVDSDKAMVQKLLYSVTD